MSEEKKELIKHPQTKEEFDELLKSGKPLLVDFFAVWCGPCQMMAPVLDEMSQTYAHMDKIEIVKVDIDAIGELAERYNVMSVPTFMLFDKKGEISESMVGMRSPDELIAKLDKLVAGEKEEK